MRTRTLVTTVALGLVLATTPKSTFSQITSQTDSLEARMDSRVSFSAAYNSLGKKFDTVYYSQKDFPTLVSLGNRLQLSPSETLKIANQDLRQKARYVAFKPSSSLFHLLELNPLDYQHIYETKPTIKKVTLDYLENLYLKEFLEATENDTCKTSAPQHQRISLHLDCLPPMSHFAEKYKQAQQNNTEVEFLKEYKQYTAEFADLLSELKFNACFTDSSSEEILAEILEKSLGEMGMEIVH